MLIPSNYIITISRRTVNGLEHHQMGRSYGQTANGIELPPCVGTLELGDCHEDVARYVFADTIARYPDHDVTLTKVHCYGEEIAAQQRIGAQE